MPKHDKKIPVSEFISDKDLKKIYEIIERSDDVETAYDRIESLLEDDFEVKDLGTNRLVFISKKKKYKDLIFKVAGDKHGIDANFREFYNGDLDKRLTFSYSISKNGVFVVQERVKPFSSDMLKEYKHELRDMLDHLSKKILLVDCKLSNFKNFGLRENGDPCLLDHGDTVPLPDYQGDKIVNLDEESFVSLRCKGLKNESSPKMKACGGKLKYSKNYDCMVCEKCGRTISVNDAYREFIGDSFVGESENRQRVHLGDSFEEWKESIQEKIQQYCVDTMSETENQNQTTTNQEENEMEKFINDEKCVQLKGYWIPERLITGSHAINLVSIKSGKLQPGDLLKKNAIDPKKYTVKGEEHIPNPEKHIKKEKPPKPEFVSHPMIPEDYTEDQEEEVKAYANKAIKLCESMVAKTGNTNSIISFDEIFGNSDSSIIPNPANIHVIWSCIKADSLVLRTKYDMNKKCFYIELKREELGLPSEKEVETAILTGNTGMNNLKKFSQKKKDLPDVEMSRPQYLVNNVCCYKEEDYYVPVGLAKDHIMSHEESKIALKSEGYVPKLFKISIAKAVPVNTSAKFVCDENETDDDEDSDKESPNHISREIEDDDDDLELGELEPIDDEDEPKSEDLKKMKRDLDELDSEVDELGKVEAVSDDEDPDSDIESGAADEDDGFKEMVEAADLPRNQRNAVMQWKKMTDLKDEILKDIGDDFDEFTEEFKDLINYDRNGVCIMSVSKVVELLDENTAHLEKTLEKFGVDPDSYDSSFAGCVSSICEEALGESCISTMNRNGEYFMEINDKKFERMKIKFENFKTLAEMSDEEFANQVTDIFADTVPDDFKADLTTFPEAFYERCSCASEFLDCVHNVYIDRNDDDGVEEEWNEIKKASLAKLAEELEEIRKTFMFAVHSAIVNYGLDKKEAVYEGYEPTNGYEAFDSEDFLYSIHLACAGEFSELGSLTKKMSPSTEDIVKLMSLVYYDCECTDEETGEKTSGNKGIAQFFIETVYHANGTASNCNGTAVINEEKEIETQESKYTLSDAERDLKTLARICAENVAAIKSIANALGLKDPTAN